MEQLELFKPKTFPQELLGNEYITLRPHHNLPEKGPIEFLLRDNKEYINLQETTLTVKVKITNADGTPILDQEGALAVLEWSGSLLVSAMMSSRRPSWIK